MKILKRKAIWDTYCWSAYLPQTSTIQVYQANAHIQVSHNYKVESSLVRIS